MYMGESNSENDACDIDSETPILATTTFDIGVTTTNTAHAKTFVVAGVINDGIG